MLTEEQLIQYHIMIPDTKDLNIIKLYLDMDYILIYKNIKNHKYYNIYSRNLLVENSRFYNKDNNVDKCKSYLLSFLSNDFKICNFKDIHNIFSTYTTLTYVNRPFIVYQIYPLTFYTCCLDL